MPLSGVQGPSPKWFNGPSISYSVPYEANSLFQNGILNNPLISKDLPEEAKDCAAKVSIEGQVTPCIPINWRFAESISALKAFQATFINLLLTRRYNIEPQDIVINTDHAALFFMSTLLWTIDPDGKPLAAISTMEREGASELVKLFPSWDIHRHSSSYHRIAATNIYKTKDDRFFHLHGSMNPDPTLDSIGLPHDRDVSSFEESWTPFIEKLSNISSEEMQHIATDIYKQAGTICWTTDEYKESAHGKSNAHVGLYEIHAYPNSKQEPSWWPNTSETSVRRPLAGLKVVDLTRVIAAPTVTRELAELGASVMRVTAPHITDYSSLHVDLNWGKWNTCLDFKKEADCAKLRELILESDVVVQSYRPGVLDKYGFGPLDILELCRERKRGIIVARVNCYGWNGPWADRSGWQQISDACCGVSIEYGRAMGNDEPVTPVFPNSDYCTGVAGATGVIDTVLRRARDGGSYLISIALNYYSQWLVNSCSVYPEAVWQDVWAAFDKPVFRHYHNMAFTLPRFVEMIEKHSADQLLRPEFFEKRHCKYIGKDIRTVKPILHFPAGKVELGYSVGTRSNGTDAPRWPADLSVEFVE